MSQVKLRTENNIPNRKVVYGAYTGIIITLATAILPVLGVELPAKEVLSEKIELIVGGVTAIIFLIQYLTRPGKGDGVKEDLK